MARGVPGGERQLRPTGPGPGPHRVGHGPGDSEDPEPGQPRVLWWPHPSARHEAREEPPSREWFPGLHGLHLFEWAGAPFKSQTQKLRPH